VAEKQRPSEAKALEEKKGLIAALKALRDPKSSFSANSEASIFIPRRRHGWKRRRKNSHSALQRLKA
jgi:hypothetical protein